MRTRFLLAAAGLAGIAMAALWWLTFLVVLPGQLRGRSLALTAIELPDEVLGWKGAPDTVLRGVLLFDVPAVLLLLLAIGLRVVSPRGRTATAATALLVAAAIAGVLVGALPYDRHTYQSSPVRAAAAVAFVVCLSGGAILAGAGLRLARERALGLVSHVLGAAMVWAAIAAGVQGALDSGPPELVSVIAVQAVAWIWFAAAGIGLLWRSLRGDRHAAPRIGVPHAGPAAAALLAAITALVVLLAGDYLGAAALAQATGRTELATLRLGAVERSYRVHRPARVAARPGLVIVLDGAYGSGLGMEVSTRFDDQAERLRWIAAYPDSVLDGWDTYGDGPGWGRHPGVDDVAFIAALIDRLEATERVDPDRVYVTGLSRGGMMSYRLGCELSSRIAAIAPVAGNMATASGSARDVGCSPARPVSVLAIHGTDDPQVPFRGGRTDIDYAPFDEVIGVWRDIDGCGAASSTSVLGPVTTATWLCRGGSAVETSVIAGGVHAWPDSGPVVRRVRGPDGALDASSAIADFFAAHPGAPVK